MPIPIGPTSIDIPQWTQAVGSVIAILVSVGLARSDIRRRNRESYRKSAGVVAYVTSHLDTSMIALDAAVLHAKLDEPPTELRDKFDRTCDVIGALRVAMPSIAALKAIPVVEWPDLDFKLAVERWSFPIESAHDSAVEGLEAFGQTQDEATRHETLDLAWQRIETAQLSYGMIEAVLAKGENILSEQRVREPWIRMLPEKLAAPIRWIKR